MLDRLWTETATGQVTVFFGRNVAARLADLEQTRPEAPFSRLLVARRWPRVPPREWMIEQTTTLLGRTALSFWPDWFDDDRDLKKDTVGESRLDQIARRKRAVLMPWFHRAKRYCRHGRPPLMKRHPPELQLRQLALAIGMERLLLVLALDAETLERGDAKCFADVCLWIAQTTQLRVAVLLEDHLIESPGLETLACNALSLSGEERISTSNSVVSSVPKSRDVDPKPLVKSAPRTQRSVKHFAWPILGRPHPLSPAEQRLARFLNADASLAGLFQFNVLVETHRGDRYIVDLCCHLAKLIIEVDGYSAHSGRAIFQSDRKRDFELAIEGYTVVRLTHAEVMRDIAAVMEKIRAILETQDIC